MKMKPNSRAETPSARPRRKGPVPESKTGASPKSKKAKPSGNDSLDQNLPSALAKMHGQFRQGWLSKHETDLPTDDSSECPFCGWDCQEDWGDGAGCRHFVTVLLCDWYEFCEDGTSGGALEHDAGVSFGSLNEAVSEFLEAARNGERQIDSLPPARLRSLLQTVAAGITGDDEDQCRSIQADSTAYGRYIQDVCSAAGIAVQRTHYDTGDPFGTSPHAFWAEDASRAARDLARAVQSDTECLKANG